MSKILTEQHKIEIIRTQSYLITTPAIPHIDKYAEVYNAGKFAVDNIELEHWDID